MRCSSAPAPNENERCFGSRLNSKPGFFAQKSTDISSCGDMRNVSIFWCGSTCSAGQTHGAGLKNTEMDTLDSPSALPLERKNGTLRQRLFFTNTFSLK